MRNLGSLGLFLTELSSLNQFEPWKYPVISALDASGAFDVAHKGLEIIRDIYSSQNILVYTEKKKSLKIIFYQRVPPYLFFQKSLKWLLWAHFWDLTAHFFSEIALDNSWSVAGLGNQNFWKLWPRKNKICFQKKCSKIFINLLFKLFFAPKWSSFNSGYADIFKKDQGSIVKEIAQKLIIRHHNFFVTEVVFQKSSEFIY